MGLHLHFLKFNMTEFNYFCFKKHHTNLSFPFSAHTHNSVCVCLWGGPSLVRGACLSVIGLPEAGFVSHWLKLTAVCFKIHLTHPPTQTMTKHSQIWFEKPHALCSSLMMSISSVLHLTSTRHKFKWQGMEKMTEPSSTWKNGLEFECLGLKSDNNKTNIFHFLKKIWEASLFNLMSGHNMGRC